jgi:hypothetical protein
MCLSIMEYKMQDFFFPLYSVKDINYGIVKQGKRKRLAVIRLKIERLRAIDERTQDQFKWKFT